MTAGKTLHIVNCGRFPRFYAARLYKDINLNFPDDAIRTMPGDDVGLSVNLEKMEKYVYIYEFTEKHVLRDITALDKEWHVQEYDPISEDCVLETLLGDTDIEIH
jgi:hypothetical protein